jgi:hypothetical protein
MHGEMKTLTSKQLLARTKFLVSDERRITLELIESLREIEHRLLFAELGYGSLFEFCTRELGLSEGSAQRRIQAMRLIRDVPEAKASLESGSLSLSNAAKVQGFFNEEKKNDRQVNKRVILEQIQDLSQRECEKKLLEISPQSVPQERARVVSPQERELKLIISEALFQKLQTLKGQLAHALPEANYAELLEYLADEALKKRNLDKTRSIHTAAESEITKRGRISLLVGIKRAVRHKAQDRCQYEHEGRLCTSTYRLEIDHIQPLALGGSNDLSNLRLLCRTHNQQQALQKLGFVKLAKTAT